MAKRGRKKNERMLLTLWENSDEEMVFSQIVSLAQQRFGFGKRTVVNYLNSLVANGVLERRVDERRRTYYKPKNLKDVFKEHLKEKIENIDDEVLLQAFLREISTEDLKYYVTLSLPEVINSLKKDLDWLGYIYEKYFKWMIAEVEKRGVLPIVYVRKWYYVARDLESLSEIWIALTLNRELRSMKMKQLLDVLIKGKSVFKEIAEDIKKLHRTVYFIGNTEQKNFRREVIASLRKHSKKIRDLIEGLSRTLKLFDK